MSARRQIKVLKNGRNQAIRIPREFESPSEDATIRKEGAFLIIEPVAKNSFLAFLRELGPVDEEFPEIPDPPPPPLPVDF
jgi:antitoxin VapB